MKLSCLQCDHEFEGSISLDELGWHSACPECEGSFDVDVPEGRIVMAFADDAEASKDGGRLTDDFGKAAIRTYYAFDSVEDFMKAWYKMADNPDGMWYWVLDSETLVCSGACDPSDEEIFADHFGFDGDAMRLKCYELLDETGLPLPKDGHPTLGRGILQI